MKATTIPRRPIFGLLMATVCLTTLSVAGADSKFHPKPESLCAVTFNIRYASSQPPNAWHQRRPVMRQCIESMAPDIIGTQEALYRQVKDLDADFPEYDWIGLGREGGSRGEFMAIFYRKARLEPLEFDHFWLSDTPNVIGSSTWGNRNRRMVTWVRFRDRDTDKEFYVWNTHLDHAVPEARKKAAELIRERVGQMDSDLPLLLLGDFNAKAEDSPPYSILVENGPFSDTWKTAKQRLSPLYATFGGYDEPQVGGVRIDWILSRGPVTPEATEIVTYHANGQYPSDHLPVVTWVTLE